MSASPIHGRWKVAGAPHRADLACEDDRLHGTLDGAKVDARFARGGEGEVVLHVGGRRVLAVVAKASEGWWVSIDGRAVLVARADAHDGATHEGGPALDPFVTSPMTGLLAKVHVVAGVAVSRGAPLFSVEAMKMEYVVKADRDVVIDEVKAKAGDRVQVGAILVTFRAPKPDVR